MTVAGNLHGAFSAEGHKNNGEQLKRDRSTCLDYKTEASGIIHKAICERNQSAC